MTFGRLARAPSRSAIVVRSRFKFIERRRVVVDIRIRQSTDSTPGNRKAPFFLICFDIFDLFLFFGFMFSSTSAIFCGVSFSLFFVQSPRARVWHQGEYSGENQSKFTLNKLCPAHIAQEKNEYRTLDLQEEKMNI